MIHSAPPSPQVHPGTRHAGGDHRWIAWLLTITVAGASSTLAFLQESATGAITPASGWKTLLHPLERNAWLGNPEVRDSSPESFTALARGPDGDFWATTSTGAVLRARDGGRSWTVVDPLSRPAASDLEPGSDLDLAGAVRQERADKVRAGPRRRWMLDPEGQVVSSTDGGTTWRPESSQPPPRFRHLAGGWRNGRVRLVATDGIHLYTSSGDGRWEPIRYRWLPAPWYFLSWGVVALLGWYSLRPPRDVRRASVADLLVSDQPIDSIRDDALGLHELALGISRFIRNENTRPPLTLAVCGEWGSGKSSLLNLLQADLRRFGFKPVWFNAWHHEQEENLVAALYAKIISQGFPSLPAWEAIAFRLRLLLRQSGRLAAVSVLSLLMLVSAAAYFRASQENLSDVLEHLYRAGERVLALIPSDSQPVPEVHADHGGGREDPVSQWVAAISGVLGLLGLARSLLARLRAFGVDPARLTASLQGSDRVRDHRERIGFYSRFAQDFADVTRALAPRRMVILMDDLDRCKPENALKVLEAVNFLVSSGECFVVMAISKHVVEGLVGSQLKEMVGGGEDGGAPATGADRQRAYARHYLEKLINIEVKVPAMTPAQVHDLLCPDHPVADPRAQAARERRRQRVLLGQRRRDASVAARGIRMGVLLVLAVVLCAISGTFGGMLARSRSAEAGAREVKSPPPAGSPGSLADPAGAPSSPRKGPGGDEASASSPSIEEALPPGPPRWWVFFSSLVALGVLLVWTVRQRGVVVSDSREFLEALGDWREVIAETHATPRAVKRFLNRVRFYAMQHRGVVMENEDLLSSLVEAWMAGSARDASGRMPRLWARLSAVARRLGRPPPEPEAEAPEPLPDRLLVAIAALHEAAPEVVQRSGIAALLQQSTLPLKSPLREECELLRDKVGLSDMATEQQTSAAAAFEQLAKGVEVR